MGLGAEQLLRWVSWRAGAVNTLWTLLRDERKRCAAVTMLGKTAELCAEQVRPLGACLASHSR